MPIIGIREIEILAQTINDLLIVTLECTDSFTYPC